MPTLEEMKQAAKKEAEERQAEVSKRQKETDDANNKLVQESDNHLQQHAKHLAVKEVQEEAQKKAETPTK